MIRHPLDTPNILFELDLKNLDTRLIGFIARLLRQGAINTPTMYTRMYFTDDIRVNHRFVDVVDASKGGRLMLEYDRFHVTEAAEVS